MNLIELTLLGIALGVDCLVVSFSQGLIFHKNRTVNSLRLAVTMGFFQGFMPIIGYFTAHGLIAYLKNFAEWIVFIIFMVLGLKFILESFSENSKAQICCIDIKCLISMGIATSIDALGAGFSLRLVEANLLEAVIVIGATSFTMSLLGFWSGNRIKNIPYLEVFGGIILLVLALKALFP